MKKHIKIFLEYYNIGLDEFILCQYCNQERAVDVHHIVYRSHGGLDEIDNLIGLCRKCHSGHHERNNPTTEQIKEKYENNKI